MQPEIKKRSKNPNPIIDTSDGSNLYLSSSLEIFLKSISFIEEDFCFLNSSSENLFSVKRPLPLCTGLKL